MVETSTWFLTQNGIGNLVGHTFVFRTSILKLYLGPVYSLNFAGQPVVVVGTAKAAADLLVSLGCMSQPQ
jgi:hypothetical protein